MTGQLYEAMENVETNLPKLRQLATALEEKMSTLQKLDQEILDSLDEEEEIVEEIEHADEVRGKLQLAIVELETAMADKSSPFVRPENPGIETRTRHRNASVISSESRRSTPSLSPPGSPSRCRGPRVKLPKLLLRRFAGNPTEWTTFWDSFESAVHTNPELTSIDKFNYLHSLLDKSAGEAVSGLKLTAANYTKKQCRS